MVHIICIATLGITTKIKGNLIKDVEVWTVHWTEKEGHFLSVLKKQV